jgi:predicted ribosome quality control (RQC) complex YloA/Tae2 family protein
LVLELKLSLTSLDLLALLKELESALISARIENIYQLAGEIFLFRFHSRSGQENLVFEPGRRLNLTRVRYIAPEKPSPTASQLRHYLLSLKVDSVGQVNFDRILYLDLSRSGGEGFRVYFELFGDGNLVIVERDGPIKYAFHYREMKDRTIKYGLPYVAPPPRGLDLTSAPPLESLHDRKFNLARMLTRTYNLPPEMVEEALTRALISPNSPSETLTRESLEAFLASARSIAEEARAGGTKPNIVVKDGKSTSVLPMEFASAAGERRYYPNFSDAVDEYFSKLDVEEATARKRSPSEEALKNLDAIMARQRTHIKELEDQRRESSETGSLIMRYLCAVQALIDHVVNSRRAGTDWISIAATGARGDVRIDSIDREKGTMALAMEGKQVPINFKESASDNAQRFFASSKEAIRKMEGLRVAMEETEEKIQKTRKGIIEASTPLEALKAMKKEWYERYRWTISSDGLLIIGGKDSTQNEVLVKKHMGSADLFVHSDVPGGSVVIIKSQGKDIPEETKLQAVTLAVSYSRAWGAKLGVADGYWVNASQVTKTPPSGEYLGKGAFMIYGERNYVKNVPLVLFLSVMFSEEGYRIMITANERQGKPEAPVVRVTPGELTGPELVTKVKGMLASRAGENYARLIRRIPPQEIEYSLPSEGCSLE